MGWIGLVWAAAALAATCCVSCARDDEARVRAGAASPDDVPEAYARPTGALMWPGASRAYLVTPEGDLENGDWRVTFAASAAGETLGSPRAIAAEDRWMPVLRWDRRSGPVRFEFEAVACPAGAARDTGLFVSLEVRATNTAPAPVEARLSVALEPRSRVARFVAPDAPEAPDAPRWLGASREGFAHGWSDARAAAAPATWSWSLPAGASQRARIVLPAYRTRTEVLREWTSVTHATRVKQTRRYWTEALERGTRFSLSDPELEHALSAAEVVLLACRERRGTAWVPIGNPFQYRDVWVRDGARAVRSLAVAGHVREARGLTDGLLLTQWPHGAFLSQRGQLDGTGQVLWALEQALLRGEPDEARIKAAAAAAWDAARWLRGQQRLGASAGGPFGGMLPFGDPRDAELSRAQLVGNDAWAIAGERAAAALLRAAGRTSDADSVEAWLADSRREFAHALEKSGARDVPPSWQGVGRDWGNYSVAIPCGALPLEHPRVVALAERLWSSSGGPGLGWYGAPDSLHTYIAMDIATWAALTGRGEESDRMLDSLLHWRTASGGAGEFFSRTTRDFGANLPPHATAAAALVSLVRDRLIHDDGDTLRLTSRARTTWWKDGQVLRAPTRYGLLDLRFTHASGEASWRWTPVAVWTALTTPPGTRAATPLPSPCVATSRGDVVLVPPGTSRLTLRVESGGAR